MMFWAMMLFLYAEKLPPQEGLLCHMFGICDSKDSQDKKLKRAFYPRMDYSETKTHYCIVIEVPGIAVKDIKIETENRNLYISGEKKQVIEEKDHKHHHQECHYGEFKRELSLPEDALIEGIQATCKENVLSITIPRKPSDRKVIAIQTA
jgi:HSP20 family molecular chaperone IbpA